MSKKQATVIAKNVLYQIIAQGGDIFNSIVVSNLIMDAVGSDDYPIVYGEAMLLLTKISNLLK